MMQYRATLFDFGGTLYSYTPFRARFEALLVETARAHGVVREADVLRRAYAEASAAVGRDCMGLPSYRHRDFFGGAGEAYVRALGAEPQPGLCDDFYAGVTEVARGVIAPREGAREVLRELRAAGVHVGIVSNIDDDQFEALWHPCGLDELVDAITTSEQAGSCKPHDRIFAIALGKAGQRAADTVFVGDSYPQDVVGARRVGMTTVLITEREPDPEHVSGSHHVIRDLRELLPILGL
jgi:HAD superfamily hydrolase (TIGR01509 family)